ncbi:outer membrane protein transport protein [Vibrio diazotrophicus]|jgi:long-chain fatty acid transport protein|uniref:outer membrane protein transport protein n=1 Tax=Vibrio diazotrophicus TaxID=685 RepID=UPI000C9E630B|nr:outer membrane protein transport protein [Vibrio diazotrophicus]MCZ4371826.1 outer membrane protein transport protein [Vibrio diazotrophicus]PNH80026.1 long-chain fatty acid transporter [Vibrio diazotrophicus]
MNKTRLFKRSLLAVTVTLATQQAMAAGFQLNAQSATGLGRAFAGDAVIADNASVMARNPAAMALFDKMELSLGFESITTMIEVKDATYAGGLVPVGDTDDVGGTSVAPNIHLVVPVNEKFAWGINAYTNFGTRTEFSSDYAASEYGGVTDVKSFNFGLSGSYRLNEQLSFGAGLDLIYGQGTLQRYASSTLSAGLAKQGLTVPKGTALANVDKADGWAVGFNLGTVYELDDNNRFGFGYHYSPEFKAEDDYGQEIVLPLPDIAEFSGFHKLEDTSFAVHYSVQWIGWSAFDQIEVNNLSASQSPIAYKLAAAKGSSTYTRNYQWQDGWHYSLGGTYYLNRDWTLRAGYMYDTSAQDSVTSISVPDSDRQWFSAGFTYAIDDASNVDFGFTYLLGKDVAVTENSAGTTLTATTHADAILMGLQYSRSF